MSKRRRHAAFAGLLQLSILVTLVATHWDPAEATPINLLTNGTFDVDRSGWTLSSQTYGSCVNYSPLHVSPSQPFDGGAVWLNACGSITNRPEISQTITTSTGATYLVSGYIQKGVYTLPAPNEFAQFEVLAAGTSLSLTFGTPDGNGWREFSASFVASSTTTLVVFGAERSADIDYRVDSLSVIETDDGSTTSSPSTSEETTTTTTAAYSPPATEPTPASTAPETTTTTSVATIDTAALPNPRSTLPQTGTDQSQHWLIAVALLFVGALFVAGSRADTDTAERGNLKK